MKRFILIINILLTTSARPNNCGNGAVMVCEKTYSPGLSMCLRDDLGSQSVWSDEKGVINYLERTLDTGVCDLVEAENGYLNYHLYECNAGTQTKTFVCSKSCNVETDKLNKVLHLSTHGRNYYVVSINNDISSGWFENRKMIPIEQPKNKIHITCGKNSQQFVIDYKLHDECEIALGDYIPRLFLRPLCSNASLILSLIFFIICMFIVILLTQYSQVRALIGTLFFIPVYLFEKLKLKVCGTCKSCGQTVHYFRRCKKTCGCGYIGNSIDELRIHKERHCSGDSRLLIATEYASTRFLKTVIAILLTLVLLSLITPISGETREQEREIMCKTWGICNNIATESPLIKLLGGTRKNLSDYYYAVVTEESTEVTTPTTEIPALVEIEMFDFSMLRKPVILSVELLIVILCVLMMNKQVKIYCASAMLKCFLTDLDKRLKSLKYNEFSVKEVYNRTTYQVTSKFLKEIFNKTKNRNSIDISLCKECMMVHTKRPQEHGTCDCGWIDEDYIDPDNLHQLTVACLLNVSSLSHTLHFSNMMKRVKVILFSLIFFLLIGTATAHCDHHDSGYVSDVVAAYQQCILDYNGHDIPKCVLNLKLEDPNAMKRCIDEPQVRYTICKLMETRIMGECISNIAVLANERNIIDAYKRNKTYANMYLDELKSTIKNFFNDPWSLLNKMNRLTNIMNIYAGRAVVFVINEMNEYKSVTCNDVPPDTVIRSILLDTIEIFKRLEAPMDSEQFLGWRGKQLLETPMTIEETTIQKREALIGSSTSTELPPTEATLSSSDEDIMYNTGRRLLTVEETEDAGVKPKYIQGALTTIYSCLNTSDQYISVGLSNESYKISNKSLTGLHYFLDISTDTLSYYINSTAVEKVITGNMSVSKIPCHYTKYNLDSIIAFGPENCPKNFMSYADDKGKKKQVLMMSSIDSKLLVYCWAYTKDNTKVYGYIQQGCYIYLDTSEGVIHDLQRCYDWTPLPNDKFATREIIKDKHLKKAIDEMSWRQYVDKYLEPIEVDIQHGKAKVVNAIKSVYKAEKTITIKGITNSKGVEGASVVFDLNLDQYESVKYTVIDKLGRELFDISLSVESARLTNEYVHSYKAPLSKGIDVRSTSNCTGACGSFKPRYNSIGYSFDKTSSWGCEEFSCWAIGTGCTWGDCKEIEDRKNGFDIYKRSSDTDLKIATVCVYLLKKGFCVDLTKNDKKVVGEFDFQSKMADTSILPDLITLDSRETVRIGQINQRGEYGLDCGNYQVVNETVYGIPNPDIHIHCHGISPKTVSAKTCWKNDNNLCSNLEEMDRSRFNIKRMDNNKIEISREHTQIGTAQIAFDIGSLTVESKEIAGQTHFRPGHCAGCYDCNLGVFCDVNIETTVRGTCKVNCTCPTTHDGLIVSPEDSLVHLHLICGAKLRTIRCTICGQQVEFPSEIKEDKSILSVNTPHERTEIESFDNKYSSWWTEVIREIGGFFSGFNILGYFSTVKIIFYVIIGFFLIYLLSIFVVPVLKITYRAVHGTYKNVIKVSKRTQQLELQERLAPVKNKRLIKVGRND